MICHIGKPLCKYSDFVNIIPHSVGDGNFVAVPNLSHDEFSQNMLNATLAELKEEAAEALAIMRMFSVNVIR